MLQKLDLGVIAGDIDTPYVPTPVVATGGVAVSLFICEGQRGWRRSAKHHESMFVLEGVITVESADGLLVVNEGEVLRVPPGVGLSYASGMRSSVVLIQERPSLTTDNGHLPSIAPTRTPVGKANVAVEVHDADAFHWQRAGVVGGFAASASRLVGEAEPYVAPAGSLVLLVYRGVLDYHAGDEADAVVGGELLVVSDDTRLRLYSERGATVVALARKDAPLPAPVVADTAGRGPDSEG